MASNELLGQFTRNPAQTRELFYAEDVQGAVLVVATTTARDAIPAAGLRVGQLLLVVASGSWFQWSGSAWVAYSGFGSSSGVIKADGSVVFTADQPFGAHKATGLLNGTSGTQDAATVAQVEALIAASTSNVADWKQSVRAATTAALPTNTRTGNVLTASANGALAAQDGVTLVAGDRFLVKNEATGANNGLYTVTSPGSVGTPWSLTRATDADVSSEVTTGLTVIVEEGTVAAGKPYILTTANPITVNTTALTFAQLSSASPDGASITTNGSSQLQRAALTGDVTAAAGSNVTAIASNAVTTAKILDASVTPAKLSALSITDIAAVDACTTANVALTGTQTPDGVTLTSGTSRVLAAFQTAPAENGVYVYNSAGAWTRAADFDAPGEFRLGVPFLIKQGALYGGQLAAVVTAPATVGTDPAAFLIGRTSNFGTDDVRTNAHVIAAATGVPAAISDNGSIESCTTGTSTARGVVARQASADTGGAHVVGAKCRGTHASPAAHAAGDALFSCLAEGYDGTAFYSAGRVRWRGISAGGADKSTAFELLVHDGAAERVIQNVRSFRKTTTDATLTTAVSIPIPADELFTLGLRWHGKQTSGSPANRAIKERTVVIRRVGTAAVTLVSENIVTAFLKDDLGWGSDSEIHYSLGAATIDITVKGKAATNVDWDVEVSWREFT